MHYFSFKKACVARPVPTSFVFAIALIFYVSIVFCIKYFLLLLYSKQLILAIEHVFF